METEKGIRDAAAERELKALLGTDFEHAEIYVYDTLDSTNAYAKQLALSEECCDAVIVAKSQTAGRGRMGRSFYSPPETGVYFSVLLRSRSLPRSTVSLTAVAAVAVMRAIRSLTGKQTLIKWVNDLYLDGKKVCGILAESVGMGADDRSVILGVGVNWYACEFPTELSSIAGTVNAERTVSKQALIARALRELAALLAGEDCIADYRAHSMVIGKKIFWMRDGIRYDGRAIGIDPSGALLVQTDTGEEQVLFSGEISLRLAEEV